MQSELWCVQALGSHRSVVDSNVDVGHLLQASRSVGGAGLCRYRKRGRGSGRGHRRSSFQSVSQLPRAPPESMPFVPDIALAPRERVQRPAKPMR